MKRKTINRELMLSLKFIEAFGFDFLDYSSPFLPVLCYFDPKFYPKPSQIFLYQLYLLPNRETGDVLIRSYQFSYWTICFASDLILSLKDEVDIFRGIFSFVSKSLFGWSFDLVIIIFVYLLKEIVV